MKILHIGYPKTGTTFLQTRIFGPLYLAGRIPAYVGNDGTKHKHYRDPVHLALRRVGRGESSQEVTSIVRDFLADNPHFVISVEGIIGQSSDSDLSKLSGRLFDLFGEDTEIVITVRDLDAYFDSLYQEMVKGDLVTSPEDAFFPRSDRLQARKNLAPDFAKYDLDRLVTAMRQFFNRVTLIDAKLPGYMIWFSERTGVPREDLEALVRAKEGSKRGLNESLSAEWVFTLALVNKVLRRLLLLIGAKSFINYPMPEEKRAFTNLERWRRLAVSASMLFKLWARSLVRGLNQLMPKRPKYKLPLDLRERIQGLVPRSELLTQVREAGGILTLESSSPAQLG